MKTCYLSNLFKVWSLLLWQILHSSLYCKYLSLFFRVSVLVRDIDRLLEGSVLSVLSQQRLAESMVVSYIDEYDEWWQGEVMGQRGHSSLTMSPAAASLPPPVSSIIIHENNKNNNQLVTHCLFSQLPWMPVILNASLEGMHEMVFIILVLCNTCENLELKDIWHWGSDFVILFNIYRYINRGVWTFKRIWNGSMNICQVLMSVEVIKQTL